MSWGMAKPGVEDTFLDGQADVEASVGHIAKARELTRRARPVVTATTTGRRCRFPLRQARTIDASRPGKHSL
jgi:hypothetical protein